MAGRTRGQSPIEPTLTSARVRAKLTRVPTRLSRHFFTRPTLRVARELLGCRLVRRIDGRRLSGIIVEVEAYIGEDDLACHGRHGRTSRNAVMFGKPGVAYVYFTYGMHWMFNIVTAREGFAAAILIRALEPVEGIALMRERRRQIVLRNLCSGPAKLTQALRIEGRDSGVDLCARRTGIWIEGEEPLAANRIGRSPRVGVDYAPEPWRSKPWRFFVRDNSCVSRSPTTGGNL